ncbi:MAG: DUF58 domain-containing protein [Planctomycetota bacterium]|nr:DUF58 domain-containing protein [Planctomycetota bacterium]MDA1177159.1 DUF58 domain-containing protein [Planctomycetota bacterium]
MSVERYLKPEVVRQIARLDLRAKFLVKGFLHGLHASPFHGFSVEFSEHRRYAPGDDPHDIDWTVFAKTEKYYVKKFEAETNMTGYIAVDKSESMAYTYRQDFSKFQYAISLAAALTYLMIGQQDPVGLVTFDDRIRQSLPPRSKRTHLGHVLTLLARLQPAGRTDVAYCINQLAAMLKHHSLVIFMTDLLADPQPILSALRRLRHGGHDVILFHILDEAEVYFPFDGQMEFEDSETGERLEVDSSGYRTSYRDQVSAFRDDYQKECLQVGVDYVPLDTSMAFDKALLEYLHSRQSRF